MYTMLFVYPVYAIAYLLFFLDSLYLYCTLSTLYTIYKTCIIHTVFILHTPYTEHIHYTILHLIQMISEEQLQAIITEIEKEAEEVYIHILSIYIYIYSVCVEGIYTHTILYVYSC